MKKLITLLSILAVTIRADAQHSGRVAENIEMLRSAGVQFPTRNLFTGVQRSMQNDSRWGQALANATALQLDQVAINAIGTERPSYFAMELPTSEGSTMILDLEYTQITAADFSVMQASTNAPAAYTPGAHYRGMVRGMPGSIAAISIFNDEVMGLVSTSEGDHVLGRLADGTDGMHVFYRTSDLRITPSHVCGTPDDGEPYDRDVLREQGSAKTVKCVRFYWEVNYDIFQGKGSIASATDYVTGLFNQSAILYANDGISVVLSQVFVWDVASPYTQTSTSDLLDQFGVTRTSFNGDLAHLLGYVGGGGIAWRNTLCNSQTRYKMAYSDVNSTFANVPTYSWSVEVVTHEQGHNLGSYHTHACVWNGNNTAIDGCGPAAGYTEGTCAQGPLPASSVGGTIMSYCHLTSSTIKFANGFGPQPLAVITNAVNNASCLTNCATTCNAPTGLTASGITTTSASLSWTAATGASGYTLQWKPTAGSTWTTVTGIASTSYALSGLTAGTSYDFKVLTVCSSGSSVYAAAVGFNTTAGSTCNVPASLVASNVTSSNATLSWGAVSGAASYTLQWKLASGSTWTTVSNIANTSYALAGLTASSSYQFQVRTNCSASSSAYSPAVTFATASSCTNAYEPNNTKATSSAVTPNVVITAQINTGTDVDWYVFGNNSTQKNIRVTLTNLPADYNLRIDRSNTQVASSAHTGTTNESIVLNNATVSSLYRARIIGSSTAFSATQCYTLTIEISATAFAMPEGMSEEAMEEEPQLLSVFPNPANDMVTVVLPAHSGPATIELLDALGRVVHLEKQAAMEAPSQLGITVTDRTEGVYSVRTTIDGETQVVRLSVTR